MAGPDPAVAAVRLAVRHALADRADAPGPVVVACSGGADSLALLAATVFECRRDAVPVLGVTVDHGLQEGSAEHAAAVVAQMAEIGATETMTVRVTVQGHGRGPEAAAREARYAVLEEVAERTGARAVLLGHTADDQAETVLLGLTRGSGGRSLAGMRRGFGPFLRPLLDLTRDRTEQACRAEGLDVWEDPHNLDERFTRVRVRRRVLPMLEAELGPGVAAALARTADGLREDTALLDDLAGSAYARLRSDVAGTGLPGAEPRDGGALALDVAGLADLPPALRHRVLRLAALEAGAPDADLFRVHVLAVAELVTGWRGQQGVDLPGRVRARRSGGTLTLGRDAVAG